MKLAPEDLRRIEKALLTDSAAGGRFPEHMMALVKSVAPNYARDPT